MIWAYEMAERRGEGCAHFEFSTFSRVCLAVPEVRVVCLYIMEERRGEGGTS